MRQREICGTCEHHYPERERNAFTGKMELRGWFCNNTKSDYCAEYTEYEDSCEHYELRGIE